MPQSNENPKIESASSRPLQARPERSVVKEFTRDGVTVQVQKTHFYHPRYALFIGTQFPDKNSPPQTPNSPPQAPQAWFAHFLPVRLDGQGRGKIQLLGPDAGVIEALVRDALDWVRDMAQAREDEDIEERLEREHRDANYGKTTPRYTGKTERERQKRKKP